MIVLQFFPGLGLVNGAFMEYGRGRIVVFGEAASFSAQLQGAKKKDRDEQSSGHTKSTISSEHHSLA